MTTLADKLYELYGFQNSPGFENNSNINIDAIVSEALDFFDNDISLLDEGFIDTFKGAFHIGNIKNPNQVKKVVSGFKIKDEKDLERMKKLVNTYGNRLPTKDQLRKKTLEMLQKMDNNFDERLYKSTFSRIVGWIGTTVLGALGSPLAIILAFLVYIIARKKGVPPSEIYNKIFSRVKKEVNIKFGAQSGLMGTAIALHNAVFYIFWTIFIFTFGFGALGLIIPTIVLLIIAALMFWAGVFKEAISSK